MGKQSTYSSSSYSALIFFLGLNDPRSYLAAGAEPAGEGDGVLKCSAEEEATARLVKEEAAAAALFAPAASSSTSAAACLV